MNESDAVVLYVIAYSRVHSTTKISNLIGSFDRYRPLLDSEPKAFSVFTVASRLLPFARALLLLIGRLPGYSYIPTRKQYNTRSWLSSSLTVPFVLNTGVLTSSKKEETLIYRGGWFRKGEAREKRTTWMSLW